MSVIADVSAAHTVVPWWVRMGAAWRGDLFDRMILSDDSAEEARVQSIRDAMLPRQQDGKRRLSIAKARLITESYRETEGLHPAIRRALAVDRVLREIPIDLLPGQLLMGTGSSGPHLVDFNPELLRIATREPGRDRPRSPLAGARTRYNFDPEDEREYEEEILPYWETRCRTAYTVAELDRHYAEAWRYTEHAGAYALPPIGGPLIHTVQGYAEIVAKGLEAVEDEIRAQIASLDPLSPSGMADFQRRDLYEAMLVVADALIAYADRNADLALGLADAERDPERAAELREMARICRRVPRHGAESWWEALQSFWFLRACTSLAEDGDSHSAGRFDQWMLPYLRRDLDAGRVTRERAQALLEHLFLKWNETANCKFAEDYLGVGNNDKLDVGGMDANGHDSANELSDMLLEAHAHVHLNDPNLAVRVHRGTPDAFLRRALEVIRLGGGLPILINDEVIVPALMGRCGVAFEDARSYADIGCQENVTDPNTTGVDTNGRNNAGWFNLPKPVELALWNGVNPLNASQVGPRTGDPRTFETMEEFVAAVRAQVEHAVRMNVVVNNVSDYVFAREFPCVYHDLLHPGPRRSGVDINAGGCHYNWTGSLAVGMANAGDILSAVDRLIYAERSATWDELLGALRDNWVGHEDLRRRCLAAPKYGCDDEGADGWTRRYLDLFFDAYESHSTPRGGRFVCGLISMGTYVSLGRQVGATPDGRTSGERLADATSASPLAPAAGPTATHRSAARAIDTYRTPNGVTFNQRFNGATVAGPRELSKWADLVRGYFEAGGQQAQYTVVDRDTLLLAQARPEEFRDLIVRVGGYSAFFVELSREVQESVIARAAPGL